MCGVATACAMLLLQVSEVRQLRSRLAAAEQQVMAARAAAASGPNPAAAQRMQVRSSALHSLVTCLYFLQLWAERMARPPQACSEMWPPHVAVLHWQRLEDCEGIKPSALLMQHWYAIVVLSVAGVGVVAGVVMPLLLSVLMLVLLLVPLLLHIAAHRS